MRFQNSERSISGPKTAPKPAHANETMPKTDEFASHAITTPITEMIISVKRATIISAFSSSLILKSPPMIFSLAADDAARS